METKGDFLLSIGWDWSHMLMMMESDRIAILYERKKRIWRALGLRVKNINVVKTLVRMLSQHMRPLVKSMVKWNK